MKTKLISFMLAFFTISLVHSQVITRTYNQYVSGGSVPVFTVDVDLDGTDDYAFVNDADYDGVGSYVCSYSYVNPLHSNALIGTFNASSMYVKAFDDGTLLDGSSATYRYDSDPYAFQFREQYFPPNASGYRFGYFAFKLNGKFGYFYIQLNAGGYCDIGWLDAFTNMRLYYARYENTINTPITINSTLALEEHLVDQLNISTVNNILSISNISDSKTMDIIVTDIRGAVLYTNTSTSHSIDLHNFSSGVYIFQIHKEGQYHTFKKIVQ